MILSVMGTMIREADRKLPTANTSQQISGRLWPMSQRSDPVGSDLRIWVSGSGSGSGFGGPKVVVWPGFGGPKMRSGSGFGGFPEDLGGPDSEDLGGPDSEGLAGIWGSQNGGLARIWGSQNEVLGQDLGVPK